MPNRNIASNHLAQYESQGFVGPIRAFDENELRGVAEAVVDSLKKQNGALCARRNRHLDWDVAYRLATARAIVDIARRSYKSVFAS